MGKAREHAFVRACMHAMSSNTRIENSISLICCSCCCIDNNSNNGNHNNAHKHKNKLLWPKTHSEVYLWLWVNGAFVHSPLCPHPTVYSSLYKCVCVEPIFTPLQIKCHYGAYSIWFDALILCGVCLYTIIFYGQWMGTNTYVHTHQCYMRQSVMMKNHIIVRFYVPFKHFILRQFVLFFSLQTYIFDAYFHVASLFVYLNCSTFFKWMLAYKHIQTEWYTYDAIQLQCCSCFFIMAKS